MDRMNKKIAALDFELNNNVIRFFKVFHGEQTLRG
jgi:hypothetical protein